MAVALPENEAQVERILRTCHALGVPVVARGAGTGLSGGALPLGDGVLLSLAKFKRILRVDPAARTARRAARRAQPRDLRSRRAVRPVLRARSLVPDRLLDRRQRRRELGRRALPQVRPHRAQRAARARVHRSTATSSSSAATRSTRRATICSRSSPAPKGLLAVITEVTVKLLPKPRARAGARWPRSTTSRRPARRWRRDRRRHHPGRPRDDGPAGHARGRAVRARRLRLDAAAILLVRVGRHARGGRRRDRAHAARCCARAGATRIRVSRDEAERLRFWSGRKAAFPAVGPHLARLLLHRRHDPAQRAARRCCARIGEMSRRSTGCAAPTCSTPATATCIR